MKRRFFSFAFAFIISATSFVTAQKPAVNTVLPQAKGDGETVLPGNLTVRGGINGNVDNKCSVSTYGAKCDGVTDDSQSIQTALTKCGSGVVELPPNKVCMAHGLIAARLTHLEMNGSTLVLNSAGSTILSYPNETAATFQDSTRPYVKNGQFTCHGLNGTGLGIHNGAMYVENVSAFNCTTGADLYEAQYGEYRSSYFSNNVVGMKLYADPHNGSATDNSFYSCGWNNNTVGIIGWANSPYPQRNTFYQAKFAVNKVAAVASFGNRQLYSGSAAQMFFYGGGGEGNSPQYPVNASPVVIDRLTIKPATLYMNNTRVNTHSFGGDSSPQYIYRLENYSQATIYDGGRAGNPSGYYASADATSGVLLYGNGGGNATYQNVLSWPDSVDGETEMFGSALIAIDPTAINSYTLNPFVIGFATTRSPATVGTVTDRQFGQVSQASFGAVAGTHSSTSVTNMVYLGGAYNAYPTSRTTVVSDYLYSVLMKADRDCTLLFSVDPKPTGFSYSSTNVTLTANQWKRVVLTAQNIAAGVQTNLVVYPLDATGPKVEFTGMEMVALPSGLSSTTETIGRILHTGAVGSNGFKQQ